MASEYTITEMESDEYLEVVRDYFRIDEGEILIDEDGFTTADGQYAEEPGMPPLPDWFGLLPWSFTEEDVEAKAADGDADEEYVLITDFDNGRLWELPR